MNYSKTLLRCSAIFAIIGVFMGSHMAGAGSIALRPIHAHILVVGWLSLFAWAVFYKVFYRKQSALALIQVWSAIIGSIGLSTGMWLHIVQPLPLPPLFTLLFYIIGGSILFISFILFMIMTFTYKEE